VIRRLGELLREHKADLGELVSIEAGKIRSEGLGEVQEMIDICDFAVGLSRQLHGLTIASERPGHRMMETWHPIGPCRRDQRLQFPGRGVVVERGAGDRVRRFRSSGSRATRRR
jgi:aldehyde dehydrogenase (NAD+)